MNTKIIRDKEKEKVFLVKFYTKQKLVREVKAKTFKKAADIIKTIFGEVCFDYVDVECCGNCSHFRYQDVDGNGICVNCSKSKKCNEYCDCWKTTER